MRSDAKPLERRQVFDALFDLVGEMVHYDGHPTIRGAIGAKVVTAAEVAGAFEHWLIGEVDPRGCTSPGCPDCGHPLAFRRAGHSAPPHLLPLPFCLQCSWGAERPLVDARVDGGKIYREACALLSQLRMTPDRALPLARKFAEWVAHVTEVDA